MMMNGIIQQPNASHQIAGVIQNFRRVSTRTGKLMAVFTVGTTSAKCFDLMVDVAQHWAVTGNKVLITGQLSNRSGQNELIAQDISLAAPGQPRAQGYPETVVASDIRPEKATMQVGDNHIVITIPRGVDTPAAKENH
jgi:hypothetical protein